jgi:hypothetical protein
MQGSTNRQITDDNKLPSSTALFAGLCRGIGLSVQGRFGTAIDETKANSLLKGK